MSVEGFDAVVVNEALVGCLTGGPTSSRVSRSEVVRSLVSDDRVSDLLALIDRINDVAESIDVDQDDAIDFSVAPAFLSHIRARYPWIDDRAGRALCGASRYRRHFGV